MSYIHDDFDFDKRFKHLPERQRRELAFLTKILFDNFQLMQARKRSKDLREGRILKIILFGSYARGDWVEDHKSGYYSDYDLLVITNNEGSANPEIWYPAEEHIRREQTARRLKPPVGLIIHSYNDIKNQLAVGRPFFRDILQDGIMLYEEKGYPLAATEPNEMTEAQRREEGQKYFDEWYPQSLLAFENAKSDFKKEKTYGKTALNIAAFEAHQAVERIYICLLLTLTLYSPKSHNIKQLRSLANAVMPELIAIWPEDKRIYKRNFELLYRAYVEARYSPQYKITAEELQWLFERIKLLQNKVKHICEEYLQNPKVTS